jgi:predicted regulator of Ras-like GTPase activity (Roadblock/LC7/MglB family)
MSLNDALKGLVETVDGGLACAVVDLNSGLMLGAYHNVPYFTQSYVDAVAAASVDMFRGKTISTVEKLLGAQRGVEVTKSIKEVQMTTDGTYHFMMIVEGKPDALLVLITNRSANLGMGWTAVRRANVEVAPLCP